MADARLHIRLLGPVEVRRGDEIVDLGGPQPRAVFTHLVLGDGRVVAADRRPEQQGPMDGPANDLARLLPLAFLAFWNVVAVSGYPDDDVARARALLSDTPIMTMATDRAPLAEALQVVIDLG